MNEQVVKQHFQGPTGRAAYYGGGTPHLYTPGRCTGPAHRSGRTADDVGNASDGQAHSGQPHWLSANAQQGTASS